MAATKDEIHPSGVAKDLRDVLDRYWVQDSEGREQIGTFAEPKSGVVFVKLSDGIYREFDASQFKDARSVGSDSCQVRLTDGTILSVAHGLDIVMSEVKRVRLANAIDEVKRELPVNATPKQAEEPKSGEWADPMATSPIVNLKRGNLTTFFYADAFKFVQRDERNPGSSVIYFKDGATRRVEFTVDEVLQAIDESLRGNRDTKAAETKPGAITLRDQLAIAALPYALEKNGNWIGDEQARQDVFKWVYEIADEMLKVRGM